MSGRPEEAEVRRLKDIANRIAWCEAWLSRQTVRNPQITREWLNLLADASYLHGRVLAQVADSKATQRAANDPKEQTR